MQKNEDILGNLDLLLEQEIEDTKDSTSTETKESVLETPSAIYEQIEEISNESQEVQQDESETMIHVENVSKSQEISQVEPASEKKSIWKGLFFLLKYITTSVTIFGILLVASNYSAYWNIAYSFIYAEEMEHTKKSLIESVAAANINESEVEEEVEEVDTFKHITPDETVVTHNMHSLSQLVGDNTKNAQLDIEITPYENRVVIPKIGKNIPLVDIKQKKVAGVDELNDIFMKELENGVIRYPGSAKPGENGNSFIFGHSSNFPWMEGDFNDVFALLDHVVYDDEVVVYYGQEKYTYKIRTKDVIKPGDVSVLQSDENDKSKITLMTCWPIGTTLNRLILTGDLISVE